MAIQSATLARIYLREEEHWLGKIIKSLHDEETVTDVTVLQGDRRFRLGWNNA